MAVTVDHGLHAASADEAARVAAYCATLDVAHHTLCWTGDKPASGLQNKARQARRQLLLDHCAAHGITNLFLAHQADDQIETLLQRLSRGSGPAGLGGMKARIVQQGITVHRPLLHLRRAALRTYCIDHAVPFHDDPANDDPRFERVRWRQIVQEIERTEPGFGAGVLRANKRLHDAAAAVAHQADQWIDTHLQRDKNGVVLPRTALANQPSATIVAILRRLMTTNRDYRVDLERLEAWVEQAFGNAPVERSLTLGGWLLRLEKERVTLCREPRRRHTP